MSDVSLHGAHGAAPPGEFLPDRRRLRRLKLRRSVIQTAVVLAVLAVIVMTVLAIRASFAARGVDFSFGFLTQPAGFQVSEGIAPALVGGLHFVAPNASMTNTQAFAVGIINTLKVAVLAIVFATVIGSAIGVGRLSTNWLIRQICFYVVEFMRNTPLLIQLTFWYTVVFLGLPALREALALPGGIFISKQGTWLPWFYVSDAAPAWALPALLVGLAAVVTSLLVKRLPRKPVAIAGLVVVIAALAAGVFTLDFPEIGKFNAKGGLRISSEFAALLVAITFNSGAYIGEIVRGAIEAMPKGQWEASAALGFSRRHTLGDIILPQVFRIVLPAFGNQYIGLAKNTSLGIAIGYPDLFNIFGTVANQTGRTLESIGIVMGIYLVISLVISALVNQLNRRFGRKEKR
jgi:His/Glu/Gln/Arg/opine family amino acid ABC transporter permease subunit